MIETELSGDEQMLRDTAARFVESACPLATVRRLIDSETGLPESYLRQIGDLGWLALLVPDGPGEGPAAATVRKQIVNNVSVLRRDGERKSYIDLLFLALVVLLCISKIVTD